MAETQITQKDTSSYRSLPNMTRLQSMLLKRTFRMRVSIDGALEYLWKIIVRVCDRMI